MELLSRLSFLDMEVPKLFLHQIYAIKDSFPLKPNFLQGFSLSYHLLIIIFVFLHYLRSKSQEIVENINCLHYQTTLFTSLCLGLFYLCQSIYHYFWSWDNITAELDLSVRLIAWFSISFYLGFVFNHTKDKKFPTLLRLWCGFFLFMSCAVITIDFVWYKKIGIMNIHLWILDFGSLLGGLVVNYTMFFGKSEGDGCSEEPLLDSDSCDEGYKNNSLLENAGFLSMLTFSWMTPLLSIGNTKTLDLDDVPNLSHNDSVNGVFPIFKHKLESYTSNDSSKITSFKLAKSLVYSIWEQVALTAIFALMFILSTYVGPYLIDFFVQYLNGIQSFSNEGVILVTAFIAAKLTERLSQRHWFFHIQEAGIRMRASLVAMIYQKGLTLSCHSRQMHTSGEIINLISVDADRIGLFSWYMHDLWTIPIQVGLALAILYTTLGLAASLAALAATILVMLANIPLGNLQEKYQEKMMECKDVRMKTTSEILRNMRILKLQAWEMKFLTKVSELRMEEATWLKKYVYTNSLVTFVFCGAPTFVAAITFGSCMLMGIPLESGKVLSALATFGVLQEPIYSLPDAISMIIQSKVSLDRIASFLCLEDLPTDAVEKMPKGTTDVAVEVNGGAFSWDICSEVPTLRDLNFKILQGMRVAVCGTVGSGKSSLLACILGEVPKVSGTVKLCGTTAYVAQSPWIQSGNIRDSILFGKEMDVDKYERVLEACSLKKDLGILPLGDMTVIGERGINLSGGQKQRVQIARALYQDADIFLFDDPFSAVDAHTGSHLFKECLIRLLASKTVIYVTHQVEFLPSADLILVLKDGNIVQAGKYNDILTSGTDFMQLVSAHKDALETLVSMDLSNGNSSSNTQYRSNSMKRSESLNGKDDQNDIIEENVAQKGQLVQEEEREKGKVGLWVYWQYITTAYKGLLVPFILLSQVMFELLQIGGNYWMALVAPASKATKPLVNGSTLIYVYVALAIGSSFCILSRSLLIANVAFETATILFYKMHMSIFRAPMSFFDSTPSGRILNRASTDQSEIDTSFPSQMGSMAFSAIQLLGIIVVMSQVAWQVFIIFIPVIAICIWYQRYYIDTARELARLFGVCKAPIIQHFAETISGMMTIRSFNQEARFTDTNFRLSDDYSRPKFYNFCATEWLCLRLDMLSSITFSFTLIFLMLLPKGFIDPGIAGLAVAYGLNLSSIQSWVIRILCNLENKVISVERILQYTSTPSEPPLAIEENRPDDSWPFMGEIELRNLQVRYAPHFPFVLKGLTYTFHGGMKTGIVGRTGSGKSTLIQAIFRIVDPTIGSIHIDGVDITTIGLHDLRLRLSIIPQDPTMFEGTVRSNLDPLEEYTDEQIWEALDCCQLGDEVRKKELKLDSSVIENGENWSMGQRQLVCLGRIILKKSKILVLDEATASVDTATDSLIQRTLRQQFSDATVVTIAHRITSVLHNDMVLLLDNGLIAEHNTPTKLLENKSSLFSKLVSEYTMRSSSQL